MLRYTAEILYVQRNNVVFKVKDFDGKNCGTELQNFPQSGWTWLFNEYILVSYKMVRCERKLLCN
jgi:hypothetical protein